MLSLMMLIYVTILIILMLFSTGPRATNVLLAGDLVPANTVLVTPTVSKLLHLI